VFIPLNNKIIKEGQIYDILKSHFRKENQVKEFDKVLQQVKQQLKDRKISLLIDEGNGEDRVIRLNHEFQQVCREVKEGKLC
jgi:hypothetical protein